MADSDTPETAHEQDGKDGVRVGFDLGGTKMYAVAFDADYKILGKDRRKTKGHLGSEGRRGAQSSTPSKTAWRTPGSPPNRSRASGSACRGSRTWTTAC